MKYYHITDKPIKIYGLTVTDKEKGRFWKLPADIMEKLPQYEYLGKRAAGGRVRFMTDSPNMCIRMTLAEAREDKNIPLSGSAGIDVYLGKGVDSYYLGCVAPDGHTEEEARAEKTFVLPDGMNLVTVNLPRNDHMLSMEIGIDDGAAIEEAPEYTYSKPVVFYGSSITEGGCAPRPGNAYTSMVCRWLDADYRNMGFSGSAKGEPVFAEYLASLDDMSVFVMDYDHNSPNPEHLEKTHEPFFKIIREAHPNMPILIMSKPDTDKNRDDSSKRRDIIEKTYKNALAAGDKNVWFLDGGTFFGKSQRAECTVDGTHPNTLGFSRMAEAVYPVLKSILEQI